MSVPSYELAPTAPPLLSQASVSIQPLEPGVGGQHSLEGEGTGEANSDDWRESLALCLLCARRHRVERLASS